MDLSTYTVADLYAIKSEAKEKEAYYRALKGANVDGAAATQQQWSNLLYHSDKELATRLMNIPQ